MRNKTKRTVENTFAAVAFAEVGEHEEAMKMAHVTDRPKKIWDRLLHWWEANNAAVAFAEAGEHEDARRWVEEKQAQRLPKDSLAGFLEKIGLDNARVSYGFIPIEN